jgi:hypothetical protein
MNVNNNQKHQSTICPCGGKYINLLSNKSRHLKTEKHQNYLLVERSKEEIEIERQKEEEEQERRIAGNTVAEADLNYRCIFNNR